MGEDKKIAEETTAKKEEGKLNIEDLKKKIEELEKQKSEYLAGWQRERADFLNYKKEEMERIGELLGYAKEEMILKILPLMDNFEVIEKKFPEDLKKDENVKGLLQVKIQFQDFLKSLGVEEIKAVSEIFNPDLHEVIEEVESSVAKAMEGKDIKSGIIVEEVQKGYKINGRLLRPAKVRITK